MNKKMTNTSFFHRAVFTAALSITLAACSSIDTRIVIKSKPETIWNILTNTPRYGEWNPFLKEVKGNIKKDETIDITIQGVGKEGLDHFSSTILEVDSLHLIQWRGRFGIPFLFDGTHNFQITVLSDSTVQFHHFETFRGIFVPFVGLDPYKQGFEKMNAALKARAETAQNSLDSN
jgi:hypothetical protein